ncbi:MAG: tetratricopeptide repeat protein [Negativicutes bacterium]|jgi:tetratricopeptide (TPR) repeat protein
MKKLLLLLTALLILSTSSVSQAWIPDFNESYNDDINRGDYDSAIALIPTNAKAYWFRGRSEVWHSQFDAAISDMNYSIKRDYNLTDSYFYRGRAYAGKAVASTDAAALTTQAIADFSETIKRDPNYGNAYFFRAGVYEQTGELNLAIADYQKYLSLKNDNTDPTLINYANQAIASLQTCCQAN